MFNFLFLMNFARMSIIHFKLFNGTLKNKRSRLRCFCLPNISNPIQKLIQLFLLFKIMWEPPYKLPFSFITN